jgi:hypothetical protein
MNFNIGDKVKAHLSYDKSEIVNIVNVRNVNTMGLSGTHYMITYTIENEVYPNGFRECYEVSQDSAIQRGWTVIPPETSSK